MAKSIIAVGRLAGEAVAGGTTVGQVLYGDTEGDTNNASLNATFSVAGVIRNPSVRLTDNTLTGDFTATLYINNVATTCVVTVSSGIGWTENTGVACQVNAGDTGRLVVASAGTGSASYNKIVLEFESDIASETLTLVGINENSSTNIPGASTTTFFSPFGNRSASGTEADVSLKTPIAATIKNLHMVVGTVSRTTDTVLTQRVEAANTAPTLTFVDADDGVGKTDTVNTVVVAAEESLAYGVAKGTGTEAFNVEKIGINMVNTSDLFFLVAGDGAGGQNAGNGTYFWPVVGSCISGTESEQEVRTPNNCASDVKVLWVEIRSNTNTGDTVFTLRKDGVDTAVTLTVPGNTTGYFPVVPGSTLNYVAGEKFTVKSTHAGGGATLTKVSAIGVVLQATGTGGAEPPAIPSDPFVQTWSLGGNSNVTSFTLPIAGATADNLLVCMATVRNGGDVFTTPTGWTLMEGTTSNGDYGNATYYRIATGTSADDFALVWTDSGRPRFTVQEFDVEGEASPYDASDESVIASVDSVNCGSATPTTTLSIAVAMMSSRDRSTWATGNTAAETEIGPPADYSNAAFNASAASRPLVCVASKVLTTTDAESPTWDTTLGGGICYASIAVFKIAASGPITHLKSLSYSAVGASSEVGTASTYTPLLAYTAIGTVTLVTNLITAITVAISNVAVGTVTLSKKVIKAIAYSATGSPTVSRGLTLSALLEYTAVGSLVTTVATAGKLTLAYIAIGTSDIVKSVGKTLGYTATGNTSEPAKTISKQLDYTATGTSDTGNVTILGAAFSYTATGIVSLVTRYIPKAIGGALKQIRRIGQKIGLGL